LIKYCLHQAGYTQVDLGEPAPKDALTFVKIDASLVEYSHVQQAFHNGQMVWLDEVDAILDEQFSQWMNGFLSGTDPKTGEKAKRPGFMLWATANGIGFKGRKLIDPAFLARLDKFVMPDPTEEDLLVIVNEKLPDSPYDTRKTIARDTYWVMQQKPDLTLRGITPKLDTVSTIYDDECRATPLKLYSNGH
jgi:MoxR-like ATPase